jgi:arginyl-tRNA synthetase
LSKEERRLVAALSTTLTERFAAGFLAVAGVAVDPAVRRSSRADFQVDGALALSRLVGRPPRDVAAEVLSHTDLGPLVESAEVAGPGFINVRLSTTSLAALLMSVNADDRLGVLLAPSPQTVLVDYSGPNVAKEMHVGHLRSTVIGDAAARLLTFVGHDVRRANHLGDWGTPFGMLIEHLLDVGEAEAADELSMGDLAGFYQAARAKFNASASFAAPSFADPSFADPSFADRSRRRVVALQSGDEATLRLWRLLVAESEKYFLSVYDRLGVTLTTVDFQRESSYNALLEPLLATLEQAGLVRVSEGATCVFPAGFLGRDGEPLPLILRKSDGGYSYGANDLAAIRHRLLDLGATRLLYVVGWEQAQHFSMVFQTAREAGWLAPPSSATHVAFGHVLGTDGRKLASRGGESVKLAELLDEAVSRAASIVAAKSPWLSPSEQAVVAQAVGIGAVKYADLSSDRNRDYVFDWDRMLATNGDTAAYLQYTHARARSILAKAGVEPDRSAAIALDHPSERALAVELLAFPEVLDEVARTLLFHQLTGYLQRLAGAFTSFYDRCPVLDAEPPVRTSRLALCDLTARTIAQGLDLLGIAAPTPM